MRSSDQVFLARLEELRSMPYADYLNTEEWQVTRKRALAFAEYRCQVCAVGDTELHVHHRDYTNLGCERGADLVALCAECHKLFHVRPEPSRFRDDIQVLTWLEDDVCWFEQYCRVDWTKSNHAHCLHELYASNLSREVTLICLLPNRELNSLIKEIKSHCGFEFYHVDLRLQPDWRERFRNESENGDLEPYIRGIFEWAEQRQKELVEAHHARREQNRRGE